MRSWESTGVSAERSGTVQQRWANAVGALSRVVTDICGRTHACACADIKADVYHFDMSHVPEDQAAFNKARNWQKIQVWRLRNGVHTRAATSQTPTRGTQGPARCPSPAPRKRLYSTHVQPRDMRRRGARGRLEFQATYTQARISCLFPVDGVSSSYKCNRPTCLPRSEHGLLLRPGVDRGSASSSLVSSEQSRRSGSITLRSSLLQFAAAA
eukprot:364280-Chlamydomonas_euryale.AAC.11